MQKQKGMPRALRGFTIIELIVVIAIIAVLAAIVLVNVTQYINKAKDAAIKSDLRAMITDAAVYIDNGNFADMSGICDDTASGFATAFAAAQANEKPDQGDRCFGGENGHWGVYIPLNNVDPRCDNGHTWLCIDGSNQIKVQCIGGLELLHNGENAYCSATPGTPL